MTDYKKRIVEGILITLCIYAALAFISLETDVTEWHLAARAALIYVSGAIIFLIHIYRGRNDND